MKACRPVPLLGAALCSACGTFVAYPGPELPDEQVATLDCYWRYYFVYIEECHVSAVDGRRPGLTQFANVSSRLAAGRHWVEFGIERYFGGGGGTTDVCAFDHDFAAGHRYRITAHSFEADIGWLAKHSSALYSGAIDLAETAPDGRVETVRVATTCSFGGGSLCRQTADCVPHPDIICQPQDG